MGVSPGRDIPCRVVLAVAIGVAAAIVPETTLITQVRPPDMRHALTSKGSCTAQRVSRAHPASSTHTGESLDPGSRANCQSKRHRVTVEMMTGTFVGGCRYESTHVAIHQNSTYDITSTYCRGATFESGTVLVRGSTLLLTPKPVQVRSASSNTRQAYPLIWGDRHYLIWRDELSNFAEEVNRGCEPRNELRGRSLLRVGDESKLTEESPYLPEPFTRLIEETPTELTPKNLAGEFEVAMPRPIGRDIKVGMHFGRVKGNLASWITVERLTSEQIFATVTGSTREGALGMPFSRRCPSLCDIDELSAR